MVIGDCSDNIYSLHAYITLTCDGAESVSLASDEVPVDGVTAGWIKKIEGENCADGYQDVTGDSGYYGFWCKRCEDGFAGTGGFVHPWWLYLIEVLSGLAVFGCVAAAIYRIKNTVNDVEGNAEALEQIYKN